MGQRIDDLNSRCESWGYHFEVSSPPNMREQKKFVVIVRVKDQVYTSFWDGGKTSQYYGKQIGDKDFEGPKNPYHTLSEQIQYYLQEEVLNGERSFMKSKYDPKINTAAPRYLRNLLNFTKPQKTKLWFLQDVFPILLGTDGNQYRMHREYVVERGWDYRLVKRPSDHTHTDVKGNKGKGKKGDGKKR